MAVRAGATQHLATLSDGGIDATRLLYAMALQHAWRGTRVNAWPRHPP